MSPRKLPPFSVRKSWRETLAFAAGLLAMVGAFGPWFRVERTRHQIMGESITESAVLHPAASLAWSLALIAAFALALGLAPLPRAWKAASRAALFGLVFAVTAIAAAAGPEGFPFLWDGIFVEYHDVRPAWGFVLAAGGALAAGLLLLSRLTERDAHPADEGVSHA